VPYCTNCGEEVTEEQRYCSYCGEFVGDGEPDDHSHGAEQRAATDRDGRERRPARAAEGERETQRSGRGTDSDGADRVARERYGRQPEAEMLPSRGTFQTYFDGLRESIRIPVALLVSFLGWALFSVPLLFFFAWVLVTGPVGMSPVIPILLIPPSVAFGLLGIGMALYATEYQYKDGEITSKTAAKQSINRFVPLLGVWLVFMVAFSVGFQLLVLPGLYIGGRLLLAFPACILDGESVRDSISISWELTRGDSLKPMGFLLSAVILSFLSSLLLSIPQGLVYSVLDVSISQAEGPFGLFELVDDPAFVVVYAVFNGLAIVVPSVGVQIAAAHMYLENRYGVRPGL
jgi:hypothetical protein